MQVVWKKLADGEPIPTARWLAIGFGVFSALCGPTALLVLGWLCELLFLPMRGADGVRFLPETLSLGRGVQIQTSVLGADGSLLRAALALIIVLAGLLGVERWTTLLTRKAALRAALIGSSNLLRRIFFQARTLSVDHGISGQRAIVRELIQTDVPRVRDALTDWYRVFPRNVVQVFVALALACWIQPWISLFAMLTIVVVWSVFGWIEAAQRKQRPVILEQRRHSHDQIAYLSEFAPLLESVDSRIDVQHMLETQMESFNEAHCKVGDEASGRSPIVIAVATLLGAFLLFVVAIRVLAPESTLHVGDIVALFGCVVFAANGIYRIRKSFRKRFGAVPAASSIWNFLSIVSARSRSLGKGTIAEVQDGIRFEHVSLRDSSRTNLLDDISLTLHPGKIHALVALDAATARSLSEMILGFGMPTSGRILIGSTNLIDIDPNSFKQKTLLINEQGPLLDGSLEENIWTDTIRDATIDILEVARRANVSEAILNMPDGLGTVLSSNDERLPPDHLYRIGIVRALLKKPSVIVAHEPRNRVSAKEEASSLHALEQLRNPLTIVVVLPERLSTLRKADQISVFKDGKLVASGTHVQLLENSEMYRHFNYTRFAI